MCWVNIVVLIFILVFGVILFLLVLKGWIQDRILKTLVATVGIVAGIAAIAVLVIPPPSLSKICETPIPTPIPSPPLPLNITKPANDTEVEFQAEVQGTTSFTQMKHYLVVKSQFGDAYIQGEVNPDPNGSWMGYATFGQASGPGVGQKFTIYVIAADSSLPIGILKTKPAEANYSNFVTVIRVR